MRIKENVLLHIFEVSAAITDFESGGILGSKNNTVIAVEFDKGLSPLKCSYEPDVEFLNSVIDIWQEDDISFAGIFHTHFFGVETLSQLDTSYIQTIMSAMPEQIRRLYFPIVLPEHKTMIPYLATKNEHGIHIQKDELELVYS